MTETAALETRRQRAARNQSLFRDVNERIEELVASSAFVQFVCECCDDDCVTPLALTVQEYERVRAVGNNFVVAPGHDVPDVEEVVDASDRYVVVAKIGAGMAVAARLDPRRRAATSRASSAAGGHG
jgi:hypothetical protein